MRHASAIVSTLEGMSRSAFRIARELTQNSRAGLTVRFLAKKLELPEEEIEYLIDIHRKFFFNDMTKVKVVPEGGVAVKRATDGLECRGDVFSLFHFVKSMGSHELRALEERLGIDVPGPKKLATETLLDLCYCNPDSLVEYVATRGFSPVAQEVFDIVWQSKDGILPVSKIHTLYGGSEYQVEEALVELFGGCALFEMFRFDGNDRLVRVAGILSELRQWRDASSDETRKQSRLKPAKGKPISVEARELALSERVCRLVAAIAARPARLRGDGELFREDRRRLDEVIPEEAEPSLTICLWVAQSAGFLACVDNELRATDLDALIEMDPLSRQRTLVEWMLSNGTEPQSRRILLHLLTEVKPGAWYLTLPAIEYVLHATAEKEQPILKPIGGHWKYVSPSISGNTEKALTRSLEETYYWLGLVDRGEHDDGSVFRLSSVGEAILLERGVERVLKAYPPKGAEIVVQPNFDIVVPTQEVDPLLTVPLERFCVRQSAGGASVYRLSKDSYTKSLQEGHDGEAFVKFLMKHNRSGALPPNVGQTLDDWRGGMKRVHVRTVHIIESDDPLVIADLKHRRRFNKYFESPDPNREIRFEKIKKSDLIKELEKEGFVFE